MNLDDEVEFPRKWLDDKRYIRIDSVTGLPQLVRVEPIMTDQGVLVPFSVMMYIDDAPGQIMDRSSAEVFVESQGCIPLEIVTQHKNYWTH
jgi:hypothetical protein